MKQDIIYNNQINRSSLIKSFKIIGIIVNFMFVIVLIGCGISNDEDTKIKDFKGGNNQFLTAIVYNATVNNLENEEVLEGGNINFTHNNSNFNYDKIQVVQGYTFKAILDFNLEPYFENDYEGKEIDIIISLFKLHSKDYDAWYEEKMIIFKTETEIVGFLCPQMGIIDELNPFPTTVDNLYFESTMFLTENEVVKYYEKGDRLYTFTADLSDEENLKLDVTSKFVFVSERETLSLSINSDSFSKVESSTVLDVMELTKIEKVNIKASILEIDMDTRILKVSSNDATSLQTVYSNFSDSIYDLNGKLISLEDLENGDIIRVYYYKRYSSYTPVNITVNEIIVEKIVKD